MEQKQYRLNVGKWVQTGHYGPTLVFEPVGNLDLEDRNELVKLAVHVLNMPDVVAVRIDEVIDGVAKC